MYHLLPMCHVYNETRIFSLLGIKEFVTLFFETNDLLWHSVDAKFRENPYASSDVITEKEHMDVEYHKLILPYYQERGLLRLNPKQHHSLSNSRHNNDWKRLRATSVCFLYIRLSTVDASRY